MNSLKDLANRYEKKILDEVGGIKDFYRIYDRAYQPILNEIKEDLIPVGGGRCCYVFTDGSGYVLKLHHPWDERYCFKCDPDPNDSVFGINYYIFPNYITDQGLAAVQEMVDCSQESRVKAYKLFGEIDEALTRINHIKNMGLKNGKPVYVDWH